MSDPCSTLREALASGRNPAEPELSAHAQGCEECRERLELAALMPREGNSSPSAHGAIAWQELSGEIGRHRGLRGWLGGLGRSARFALVAGLGAAVILAQLLNERADLSEYPLGHMLAVVLPLAGLALLTWWLGARPLHRAPLPRWSRWALAGALVVLPVALALLPEAHTGHAASQGGTGSALLSRALACFVYGGLFAAPVLILAGLSDRARGQTPLPPLAAAGAAALVANALLQLHCPLTHPAHLLAGHASVSLVWVGGALLWWAWRGRREPNGAAG